MEIKKHAIQLVDLKIIELSFQARDSSAFRDDLEIEELSLISGYTDFDEKNKTINVKVRATIGDDDDYPLRLVVDIRGKFSVNTDEFEIGNIESWAKRNAPLILYPYVRENVYSLSSRVGLKAVLLPLLEIPSFKIIKK